MNTDNQMLILVDENDNFTGKYAKRIDCHTGKGIKHRAFVTLLENEKGEVLLQKRKHTLWDGYWDTTAISHNLHLEDHDETYEEAAERTQNVEMGISNVLVKKIGGFPYFAKFGTMCENEYCAILSGTYNGEVNPNKDVVYDYLWLDKQTFINNCLKEDKTYTPWALLTGKFLATKH
jgi:isopentenyl-diphosphate delta-isomerase